MCRDPIWFCYIEVTYLKKKIHLKWIRAIEYLNEIMALIISWSEEVSKSQRRNVCLTNPYWTLYRRMIRILAQSVRRLNVSTRRIHYTSVINLECLFAYYLFTLRSEYAHMLDWQGKLGTGSSVLKKFILDRIDLCENQKWWGTVPHAFWTQSNTFGMTAESLDFPNISGVLHRSLEIIYYRSSENIEHSPAIAQTNGGVLRISLA